MLPASVLLGVLTAAPAVSGGASVREVEEDHSLTASLVTPHKPWARGCAGGPVRALFFVYSGPYAGDWCDPGTRLREVVELAERLDLEADAVLFGGPTPSGTWEFHGQRTGRERAERLLAKPYQVYVIAGFAMEKLPARFQFLIIEQVARGAGLVCCGPGAPEFTSLKRRIDPLPAAMTDALPALDGAEPKAYTTAYRMGKGRGVWLNYGAHALTPYYEFTWRRLAEYDYRMLAVVRAVLWAASREGPISIAVAGKPAGRVARGQPGPGVTFTLLSKAAEPLPVQVLIGLRRAGDGQVSNQGTVAATLEPGRPSPVPIRLPRLRAGDYFVDAVVRGARGVEAFGACAVTVHGDFGVERVQLNRDFAERGETVGGSAVLRGTPPPGSVLRIRWRDSYNRVLRQQDFAAEAGRAAYGIQYQADRFATTLMRAEAVLVTGGEEVEMQDAPLMVPKRRHGQFNFVQWDAPRDVLGYYAWRRLQQAGMNISLIGSMGGVTPPPPVLLACDATVAPYSTRLLDEKDAAGRMQPVCWNHQPAVDEYVARIVDNQRQLRRQGVFVYSLGDEGVTLGCCVHPACLAAYRRYLAGQYGSIGALNASWGSHYPSFDAVDLLDRKDNMETAAIKTAPARWFDRQAFARFNLAQFAGRFAAAYKRIDPQAITGFEGTGAFGDDYDAILDAIPFYGPYPSIGDDIVRSAAPRSHVRSNWMGYSKTADALSDAAWRMILNGVDSVWYWMWSGAGNWRGYLSPNLDFWPVTAELTEEMRPVRQGLGDLLLVSTAVHSRLGVFYSVPSAIADQLAPGSGLQSALAAHQAWTQLTSELGLDFRYLTAAMLRRGALDPRQFRVLLLPTALAVSPEQAESMRKFVEAGGTLIADVQPGVYDGHCKPLARGALDDLFGIRRRGRQAAVRRPVAVHSVVAGRVVNVEFPEAAVDPQVELVTAQALAHAGQWPVMLVNQVGRGRAVLLNFQLPPPGGSQDRTPAAAAAWRLLASLYDGAGVKPPVASGDPRGNPLPLVETRVWKNGDALVVGLYRQMECQWFSPTADTTAGAPVAARLTFDQPRWLYDLRGQPQPLRDLRGENGRGLGLRSQIDARLAWGRANFYLASPYRIPPPRIRLSDSQPAAGHTITAAIRLVVPPGFTQRHAVWLEITDPNGGRPLWGQQVRLLDDGAASVEIPIAYNDLPGTWCIKATELFSRGSAEARWTVSGR
jgi:hypothetical protein